MTEVESVRRLERAERRWLAEARRRLQQSAWRRRRGERRGERRGDGEQQR
jgi:hypothetical protein